MTCFGKKINLLVGYQENIASMFHTQEYRFGDDYMKKIYTQNSET